MSTYPSLTKAIRNDIEAARDGLGNAIEALDQDGFKDALVRIKKAKQRLENARQLCDAAATWGDEILPRLDAACKETLDEIERRTT